MKLRVYRPLRLGTAAILLGLGALAYPERNLDIGFGQPYHYYVWLAFLVAGVASIVVALQPPKGTGL